MASWKALKYPDKIKSLTCSPNGQFLAIQTENQDNCILVDLYDVQKEKSLDWSTFCHDQNLMTAFSPQNDLLAISVNSCLYLYHLRNDRLSYILERNFENSSITCLNFQSQNLLAIGHQNGYIHIFNLTIGSVVAKMNCWNREGNNLEVYSLNFSPTRGHIATCSDNSIHFFDNTTNGKIMITNKSKITRKSVLSPDGNSLAVILENNDLVIVTLINGHQKVYNNLGMIQCGFFLPNGQYIAVTAEDGKLVLKDLVKGKIQYSMGMSMFSDMKFGECYMSSQKPYLFTWMKRYNDQHIGVCYLTLGQGSLVKSAGKRS